MQVYRIFYCFCHNILASFCGLNSDITPIAIPNDMNGIYGSGIANINYAYKIGHIVIFSIDTVNITKTAGSNLPLDCVRNPALVPKGKVAVTLCVGASKHVLSDCTATITPDGLLTFTGNGSITNQAFIVSGVYYIE